MAYMLEEINYRTVADPKEFVEESDARYYDSVRLAAHTIASVKAASPIVLLAGPSGSGKTTTAMKLTEALEKIGIGTHYISMDEYYRDVDDTYPRTEDGKPDYESPDALKLDLINRHLSGLVKGETADIPRYDFASSSCTGEISKSIRLGKDEIVIMEGIHALNPAVTGGQTGAFRLYIAPESPVTFRGEVVFRSHWFRLVRRCVRDHIFRGTDAEGTMAAWDNVRRGEMKYIAPYIKTADLRFDTSLPYELPLMRRTATEQFCHVPEGIKRYDELRMVLPALQLVGDIDESLVPRNALVREFIGGGEYEY